MRLQTNVGQIFLTHPKDQNYTSLYQEAFSKHGQSVELFATLEIMSPEPNSLNRRKTECEKLTQALVGAFKRTYIAASNIDHDTFERALAAINATLSRLAGRSQLNWYGRFNAAVGAVFQNQLAISTTGNAVVYLVRKGEYTLLSEDLAEANRPLKIFSNYSGGRIAEGDRIILSTNQLFNYLSLDRLQEFLAEETLEETCQELITALQEIKTTGFATFIFEITGEGQKALIEKPQPQRTIEQALQRTVGIKATKTKTSLNLLLSLGKFLWGLLTNLLGSLLALVINFFRRRPKKYLFTAIGIVLVFLLINIVAATWNKSAQEKQNRVSSTIFQVQEMPDEAEASRIYNDENKVLTLITEAETLLTKIDKKNSSPYQAQEDRLNTLKNKVRKEVRVDNPTILTQFPHIPTTIVRSPNGILGWNRNSLTLGFFDFRLGETRTLLKNQTTGHLVDVEFLGSPHGYVFLTKDGRMEKLSLDQDQLIKFDPDAQVVDLNKAKIQSLKVLGEGTLARFYLLDLNQNQIWRLRTTETAIASAEKWLKSENNNLQGARDMGVDGGIYLLYPDRVEKYFNGLRQNFELQEVSPPLKNSSKIFTKADYQFLYILDPENLRVLIFTKTGKLQNQILSPKFHDLADLYVDEKNRLMYVLAGSELLQMNLKQ